MTTRSILRDFIIAAIFAALFVSFIREAPAHDSWINRGGFTGKGQGANELCCGENDCFVIPSAGVRIGSNGFELLSIVGIGVIETVPYSEAQPSPDGQYWRCRRPDGTRRCFFAPPPGT